MSEPVSLLGLPVDQKLYVMMPGSSADRILTVDELSVEIEEGLRPQGRLYLADPVYHIPGFTSEDIWDSMSSALEDHVEDAGEVLERIPNAKCAALASALDAMWKSMEDSKTPLYYECSDTLVLVTLSKDRYADAFQAEQGAFLLSVVGAAESPTKITYVNEWGNREDLSVRFNLETICWGINAAWGVFTWLIDGSIVGADGVEQPIKTFNLEKIRILK